MALKTRLTWMISRFIVRNLPAFILLFSSLVTTLVCAEPAENRIHFQTPTRAFTHEWYVALEGPTNRPTLWMKFNEETTGRRGQWYPVGVDGRPGILESYEYITRIAADGDNLIAIANSGRVYYTKFSSYQVYQEGKFIILEWVNTFGRPKWMIGRKLPLYLPNDYKTIAISHRGGLIGGYEDIDENFHKGKFGVTTLYLLSPDGLDLHYADPWLPNHFNRFIGLPTDEEGRRMRVRNLSASASTIFVINDAGHMYTRLADFDTIGENPWFSYTYQRSFRDPERSKGVKGGVRTLPAEPWVRQPRIPGQITDQIVIHSTNDDTEMRNHRRRLRVEGINAEGQTGYWTKTITASSWDFVVTHHELLGERLSENTIEDALWGPRKGEDYLNGDFTSKALDHAMKGELYNFHPMTRQAKIRLSTVHGMVNLILHTYRLNDYHPRGNKVYGALERPSDEHLQDNPELQVILNQVFSDKIRIEGNVYYDEENKTVRFKSDRFQGIERIRITFRQD